MPSAEYYLQQAETATLLALAESDPQKAAAFRVLALQNYEKANQARAEPPPGDDKLPEI